MRRSPIPLAAPLLAAALATLLGGCAGHRETVPDNVGFHELRESFGDRDLSPLQDRRILLDPGHGGVFRGVVGLDGLAEADVNLGVALWLRGLLEAAGAEVHMTRTADVDLLTPTDSTLAADLTARSALCDSLRPDVFVSLHHNSNAALDRDMNETQTYYPMGREGADLDLARAIHKHLVRNLEIEPARIMAGNFSVLRNATVPAVLGEPAMLSHPGVEQKLSAAGKQRLEAEAYFLGLLEYFEGGTPYWELVSDMAEWRDGHVSWRFIADSRSPETAPGIDPMSIRLDVNGEQAPFHFDVDDRTVTWNAPKRADAPASTLSLSARNLHGRSTPETILESVYPRTATPSFMTFPTSTDPSAPHLLVWNEAGLKPDLPRQYFFTPSDSLPLVTLAPEGPRFRTSIVTPPEDWDGAFLWALDDEGHLLKCHNSRKYPLSDEFRIEWHVLIDPEAQQVLPDGRWAIRHHPGTDEWPPHMVLMYRNQQWPAFCSLDDAPAWLELRGARPILMDATHRTPWQAPCDSPRDTIVWQPLVPGLVGKTIVIDPHGGAADADGTAPMGTPGRELNLRVAERLAHLLRGAGAEAVLTRDDPGWVPPEAKVLMANEADADLFITLRRADAAGPAWRVAHHYGSRGGSAWAGYLAQTLGRLASPDTVAIAKSYAYLLRHTACPAVDVSLPMPADLDAEELWRAPAYQQAVASELLNATAAWFQGPDLLTSLADPRTFMVERQIPGRPVELTGLDWIRVDGNWLWLPPRADAIPPARLPLPGVEHTFEARRGEAWELYVSGDGEGDRVWVRPFWTSERQPTNPYATTEPVNEADAP